MLDVDTCRHALFINLIDSFIVRVMCYVVYRVIGLLLINQILLNLFIRYTLDSQQEPYDFLIYLETHDYN